MPLCHTTTRAGIFREAKPGTKQNIYARRY